MTRKRIEGYWVCSHCGKTVGGLTKKCPGCGNPQSKGVKFDPKGGPKRYLEPEIAKEYGKGADWVCAYCGSYNRYNKLVCENCGAGKADSEEDYFGNEVKVTPKEDYNSEHYMSDDKELQSETEEEEKAEDAETPKAEESLSPWKEDESSDNFYQYYDYMKQNNSYNNHDENKSFSTKMQNFLKNINFKAVFAFLGGTASIIAIVMLLVWIFTPRTYDAQVADKTWNRNVTIQELRTFDESDWDVPVGARVYDERQEIRDYDKVIDHYDIVEHEVPREVFDHYDYEYYDNGDGTFDEERIEVNKTVYDIEYEKVPVYDYIPIYDTKYYYEIDRWVYDRTEKSSGKMDVPYWPEFTLGTKERESGRSETYTIYFETEKKTYSKTVSYEEWKKFNLGEKYHITIVAGIVTEIEP